MAKPYNVTITNGVGNQAVVNDNYSISSLTNGYDDDKILPKTIEVTSDQSEYTFEIEASGTLMLHVTDTGQIDGTAITGATFVRCDSEGTTYGSPITSDSTGNAVFNYVPFAETDSPKIYYKQTASDGEHDFDDTLKEIQLTTSTSTIEVQNASAQLKTFNLTDKNYSGLKIDTSTITLS